MLVTWPQHRTFCLAAAAVFAALTIVLLRYMGKALRTSVVDSMHAHQVTGVFRSDTRFDYEGTTTVYLLGDWLVEFPPAWLNELEEGEMTADVCEIGITDFDRRYYSARHRGLLMSVGRVLSVELGPPRR